VHASSAVIEMSPDEVDAAIRRFEEVLLPRYREISGYKGFTLLLDRENGKGLGVFFWESKEGVFAADDLGVEARQALGGSAHSREVWEVAIDEQNQRHSGASGDGGGGGGGGGPRVCTARAGNIDPRADDA